MILTGQRCPACHRLELVVENDRESCDRCHYALEFEDMLGDRADAMLKRARDRDEGWGEAASTFVRDLDEQRMARSGD